MEAIVAFLLNIRDDFLYSYTRENPEKNKLLYQKKDMEIKIKYYRKLLIYYSCVLIVVMIIEIFQ